MHGGGVLGGGVSDGGGVSGDGSRELVVRSLSSDQEAVSGSDSVGGEGRSLGDVRKRAGARGARQGDRSRDKGEESRARPRRNERSKVSLVLRNLARVKAESDGLLTLKRSTVALAWTPGCLKTAETTAPLAFFSGLRVVARSSLRPLASWFSSST